MKKQLSKHGFTLIEVMVVIAIIGILTAIAVPRFNTTINRYYARGAARELMIQFKKSKLAAVKHYRDVCIDFINVGAPNGQYKIFVNVDRDFNTPHTFDPADGDILLATRQLNSKILFLSTSFTNNQAGYNSRGLPLQLGSIVLGTGTTDIRSYTLSVSSTGKVRIQ